MGPEQISELGPQRVATWAASSREQVLAVLPYPRQPLLGEKVKNFDLDSPTRVLAFYASTKWRGEMALQEIPKFAGTIGITIAVPDSVAAAEFYSKAFGATAVARYIVPHHGVEKVKGVTLRIGAAVIELSTANPRTPDGPPRRRKCCKVSARF